MPSHNIHLLERRDVSREFVRRSQCGLDPCQCTALLFPTIPRRSLTKLDAIDLPRPPLTPPDHPDRHLHRPGHAVSRAPRPSLPLHILRPAAGEITRLPLTAFKLPTRPDLLTKQRLGPYHEQYTHAHPSQLTRSNLRRRHCGKCLGRRCLLVLCGNPR